MNRYATLTPMITRKLLVICLLTGLHLPSVLAEPREVRLYEYEGKVKIWRNGQPVKIERDETPLKAGDTVVTSSEGSAALIFYDFGGCRLSADTQVVLESPSKSFIRMRLESGQVLYSIKRPPSDAVFELKTWLVTAQAKGTQFLGRIRMEPREIHTFSLLLGSLTVNLKESGTSLSLVPGTSADIEKGTYTPPVREHSEEERADLKTANSIITRV